MYINDKAVQTDQKQKVIAMP